MFVGAIPALALLRPASSILSSAGAHVAQSCRADGRQRRLLQHRRLPVCCSSGQQQQNFSEMNTARPTDLRPAHIRLLAPCTGLSRASSKVLLLWA